MVKVIGQKCHIAAAHGQFSRTRQVLPMCTPSNTCLLGTTPVHTPNTIPIGSAVFAKLTAESPHTGHIRGLFQKFLKKHNTTTLTSLFFHIISANFNALVPSFLQLLYTSLVEEFILPMNKDLHIHNDVIVTWKMCATQVFFQHWEQIQVGGC